jgi:hypothetical protein
MDYYNFNQVMSPIVAVGPDMVSLLEQTNTSPGTWYTGIDLVYDYFSPPFSIRLPEEVCFQLARPTLHLHCSISGVFQLSHPTL